MQGAGAGSEIVAMSCASADSCEAADAGNPRSAIAQKVPVAPTSTAVSASARSVVYGHEGVQRISVTVSATSGVPTGTVAVKAGTATVCAITLTGGHGSCALSATRFAAGTVRLTAAYADPAWFAASTSPATSFTVVKERTKTALHLSAVTIRYGHEQAEKYSVTVTPAFASAAHANGKVTVKAGNVTLCVITLKTGRGSCTPSGKRLRAGTYHPTAVYAGGIDFAGSTSNRTTLLQEVALQSQKADPRTRRAAPRREHDRESMITNLFRSYSMNHLRRKKNFRDHEPDMARGGQIDERLAK
jgi:hypothetical protein